MKLSLIYTRPVSATSLRREAEEEHWSRNVASSLEGSRAFSRLLIWEEVTLYEANVKGVEMFHVAGAVLTFSCKHPLIFPLYWHRMSRILWTNDRN